MRTTFLLVAGLAIPCIARAQSDARPEILVLGTFHMANPGRDVHNMHADDMLSAKRQQEISQLVDVLQRFHPTKIAIEEDFGSEKVKQTYTDYLGGRYTLPRDESYQIGFRLAKAAGLQTVYPVDEMWDFPYMRVLNYAKANGRLAQFNALDTAMAGRVKQQNDLLASHSVLETLEYMNADSTVARDVASYFAFVPFGDPDDDAGADLLAAWYQRNMHIYRNIVSLIDSPKDRILVVYGAGHLGWLRQDIANDATVRLRTLADFAGKH